MSQKVILLGAVEGTIPKVGISGSLTKAGGVTVEVTTAGVSAAAKITVTADDGTVALAERAVTSGTAIAMASGYGSITVTWDSGYLCKGDVWVYTVTGGTATKPAAYEKNRSGVYHIQKVTSDGDQVTANEYSIAIHNGHLFRAGFQKNITSAGTAILAITTPAGEAIHFTPQVTGEGEIEVEFVEAPTSITGGTTVTPRNANRNSASVSTAVLKADPAWVRGAGVTLGKVVVGDGRRSGGTAAPDGEWILKPSTLYVMLVTDQSTSANEVNIRWYWIEK